MNNQEYEQKKRECFVKFCKDNGIDQEVNISIFDAFDQIFDRAYALGKQEKEADTVIQGWVARDLDRALQLWESKPQRNDITNDEWGMANGIILLPTDLFPDLTWESDPIEVEIILKRKKNG